MAQFCKTFKRYEKKYLLTEEQYHAVRRTLEPLMAADAYGKSTIQNIYYDTPDWALIRASLEKPVYKEKLRLRSYGTPDSGSTVFVELKKKYKGIVYKRREAMSLAEAERYLAAGLKPGRDSQILREIDWFLDYWHPLPRVMIAYDRIALFGRDDPELRITFDSNLRWRDTVLDLSKGPWGGLLSDPGQYLMEVKISGAMPLWMSRMLSELQIPQSSFSKYGECYKRFLLPKIQMKGGIICA